MQLSLSLKIQRNDIINCSPVQLSVVPFADCPKTIWITIHQGRFAASIATSVFGVVALLYQKIRGLTI